MVAKVSNVHPIQSPEVIRAEARAWVLKFSSDTGPSQADIASLRQWASRNPAHRSALEQAEKFWQDADMLKELAVPVSRSRKQFRLDLVLAGFHRLAGVFGSINRAPAFAAVMLVAITLAVSTWLWVIPGSVVNGTYRTAIGEQKTLALADGSQILLDTNAGVTIDYNEQSRSIHLHHGKAHFDVVPAQDLPFEVYAGVGMVRAVGTSFSVYLSDQDIEVVVDEGKVELARVQAPATDTGAPIDTPRIANVFLSLEKGQSASFNETREEKKALPRSALSQKLAWREGLLIFTGDPLHEVVAEVSRYTATRIEISDPALGDLAIGGRFRVGELDALFDSLETGFGVQVSHLNKDHVQLGAAPRNGTGKL